MSKTNTEYTLTTVQTEIGEVVIEGWAGHEGFDIAYPCNGDWEYSHAPTMAAALDTIVHDIIPFLSC